MKITTVPGSFFDKLDKEATKKAIKKAKEFFEETPTQPSTQGQLRLEESEAK